MPKQATDVFTPRNPEVNVAMYIARPDLELSLKLALQGALHVLVHGESGSGKSWLFKRVLVSTGTAFATANLANASRFNSIEKELASLVDSVGAAVKDSYSETKETEFGIPAIASGGLSHQGNFVLPQKEPVERCLEFLNKQAKGKPSVLVMDNLEAIFGNPDVMRELGDIVVLLDDARYAKYKVKLLLVGVPHAVREYFSKSVNRETVSNRIQEVPEVSRLTEAQTADLVRRGFADELQMSVKPEILEGLEKHVAWVTDGVPQRVHEYCLQVAQLAEQENRTIKQEMLKTSDRRWLESALSNCYTAVESSMNERETKAGRRNQTLLALAQLKGQEIKLADVEEAVRREFPNSTADTALNISGTLSQLAQMKPGLIRRTPKGDGYMFTDPRYRMCLRAMLYKSETGEVVEKIDIAEV